ncbi:tetratricopeptide repeat family [Chrysochromulina tobinii]|uniref:Tetratricopeptide repeat family n=1 Tax=Chrysochromulina tobinii TaxID=1460289 RepID=A0A0M0JZQ2_9EUKA|nr:tetratricopeptide repeat family [Chrysochromulina tobinii]|eukprot:KOO31608.1 tetratricopeptide repeat family [Chrysochromulina sp. CCMP291]
MAFVRAGVPHVVGVRSQSLVLDAAAITFTRQFYLALSVGQSVKKAFDVAQAAVCAMPPRLTSHKPAALESGKFVLLGNGDHESAVILQRPPGLLTDKTRARCVTNVPAPSASFVGRQRQMHQAVAALSGTRRRCVVLVGAGGIGKTALASSVCHYVRHRHAFPDGVFHTEVRGIASAMQLTYAIALALRLPGVAEADEAHVAAEVIGALSTKQLLLYLDRCDELTGGGEQSAGFSDLVSKILRRCPKVKLLLTCRREIGIPDEQPLTIAVPQLSELEAISLLQTMARVPPTHAASIAELCGCMPLALRLCGCALSSQRVAAQLCIMEDAGALSAFDNERHNIETILAVSREHASETFPGLLASGRLLLRYRLDPGSRRSLILDALEVAERHASTERTAADGDRGHAVVPAVAQGSAEVHARAVLPTTPNAHLLACLRIELGYVDGEQQRRADGSAEYARAIILTAGVDAGAAILYEAGLPFPDMGIAPPSKPPPLPIHRDASSAPSLTLAEVSAASGAASASGKEAAALEEGAGPTASTVRGLANLSSVDLASEVDFDAALHGFIADAGVGLTPPSAHHELVSEALNLLAVSLDGRGLARASQIIFIHTIRIRHAMLGTAHPLTAAVYNNLANLLRGKVLEGVRPASGSGGGSAEAPPSLMTISSGSSSGRNLSFGNSERSLSERSLSERSLSFVAADAAATSRAASSEAFVEALYRRAIAVREQVLGPKSPTLAASLSNFSVLLARRRTGVAIEEAERLLRRGLAIRQSVFGEEHPETASSYNLLGNLLFYQKGELDAAERLYQRALAIREVYYTRMSDRVGQTLHNLASLARQKGDYEKAERLSVECLQIRERVTPLGHKDTMSTCKVLMSVYSKQGKLEDARRIQRKLKAAEEERDKCSSGDMTWLRAKVPFRPTEVPHGFRLTGRITGPRNLHLRHIMQQSGAERIFLRLGNGSAGERGGGEGLDEERASEHSWPDAPEDLGGSRRPDAPVEEAAEATCTPAPPRLASPVNGAAAPAAEPASPAPSTPKTTPDTTPTANTPTTARSGEPPPVAVLHVQASSDKALRRAVELCEDHLRNVGLDLAKWRRQPSSGNYSVGRHR